MAYGIRRSLLSMGDPDARAYILRAGVTDPLAKASLTKFVQGIKALGLWNSMVCWPLISTQNKGTGTTVYSLGGLGTYNGTLVGSLTWGASGIVMATSGYISTALTPNNQSYTSIAFGNFTNNSDYYRVFGGVGTDSDLCLVQSTNGIMPFRQAVGVNAGNVAASPVGVHMLAIAKNANSVLGAIDGTTGTWTYATTTNVTLWLGGNGISNNTVVGSLANCLSFSQPLTAPTLAAIYTLYKATLGASLGLP